MFSESFKFQFRWACPSKMKIAIWTTAVRDETQRGIANPVGRERLNHRRKPQFAYYANAIQRSNEVGGLLVRILGVPHVRRRGIN